MGKKKDCLHFKFESEIKITRLTESDDSDKVIGYTSDIKIRCAECKHPFEFIGLFAGVSNASPMVSMDLQELRAPIKPYEGKIATGARYGVKDSPPPPDPTKGN